MDLVELARDVNGWLGFVAFAFSASSLFYVGCYELFFEWAYFFKVVLVQAPQIILLGGYYYYPLRCM